MMTAKQQKLLVKAPAFISVLAAVKNHKINYPQKAHAIKLAHLNSFSSDPELRTYYEKVDTNFIKNFERIARHYAPFDDEQLHALKKEIETLTVLFQHLTAKWQQSFTKASLIIPNT